jgi:hypothetical protein
MSEDQSTPEEQPEFSGQPKGFKPPLPTSGPFGFNGQQNLPNSTPVLIMGILSILTCCCYGLVGIIFGVIGLVLGNKDRALYNQNPEAYKLSSFKNSNAGRICSIIGLSLSALYLIAIILCVVFFGFAALKDPALMKQILENR